jgi:molecular chaperone GrpE
MAEKNENIYEEDPLAPEPAPQDDVVTENAAAENGDAARVETLQSELAQAKDQVLRALADAENTRKRALKEREDASKYAVAGFARELLSVADNLRRALDAVPEDLLQGEPRIKNLLDGIEATERELLKSFEKSHIRKIEPLGEVFNPNYHEVMFETPGTGKPPGTIIQVVEAGYVLHDRLLRPARVGVAKDEGQGNGKTAGGHIDTQA